MVSQISGKFTYLNDGTTAHLGVGPAVQDAGQKRPVREMPSDAPWTALGVCGIKRRGLATLLIFTATVSSTCSRVVSAPVVWTRGGQHLIRGGQNSSPVEPNPNYQYTYTIINKYYTAEKLGNYNQKRVRINYHYPHTGVQLSLYACVSVCLSVRSSASIFGNNSRGP